MAANVFALVPTGSALVTHLHAINNAFVSMLGIGDLVPPLFED